MLYLGIQRLCRVLGAYLIHESQNLASMEQHDPHIKELNKGNTYL